MNRSEFAEKLAKKAEIPQTRARQILDIIFSTETREGIIAVELDAGRDGIHALDVGADDQAHRYV